MGAHAEIIRRLNEVIRGGQVLGRAAQTIHTLHADRIFGIGIAADGRKIGGGKYSSNYAKQRKKKGRQTRFIDLRMRGDMERSYQLIIDTNGYASGFMSKVENTKAEYNEYGYRQHIFELSEKEKNKFIQLVDKYTGEILRG